MILGKTITLETYRANLPAAVARALEAVEKIDLLALDYGRHDIDGDNVFFVRQKADLLELDKARPEAHYEYADIHLPLSTVERVAFSHAEDGIVVTDAYNAQRDIIFYQAPRHEVLIDLTPGEFIVFLPYEIHRPCLRVAEASSVEKIVIKIHKSQLNIA